MAITESEMQTLRDMFMDCAKDIVKAERETAGELIKGVETRLDAIDERLGNIEEDIIRQGHVMAEVNVEVAKLNLASKVDAAKRTRGAKG